MKAIVMSSGDTLTLAPLGGELVEAGLSQTSHISTMAALISHDQEPASLKALERDHILAVLEHTKGHKGKACEILGISRPRLERRLKEYNFAAD
jgi:DNA-binding NtrC family response regulator